MRQPEIRLLDFSPAGGSAASLLPILVRAAAVKRFACTVAVNGTIDGLAACATSQPKANDVFVIALPPSLQDQAISVLKCVKDEFSCAQTIIALEVEEADCVMDLIHSGVDEFFVPPFRAIDILPRVKRLLERAAPEEALIETVKSRVALKQLVGDSPIFVNQMKKIPLVAKFNTQVLILGETGTGKELCARAIHYLSPRASKAFVPINCGAVPVDLVENELFGHARGAFTGAANARRGLIEDAEGGTLFLDEVDALPLLAQVKLLRFLQEKEFRPLGSTRIRHADVRVIAAANSNLQEAVKRGRLREDLFYRLNIVPIELPALRQRPEDIPALAKHFLRRYEVEFGKQLEGFSAEATQALMVYAWPGNVRELEHVVERAAVLAQDKVIQRSDLVLPKEEVQEAQQSLRCAKASLIARFEKTYIQGLLAAHDGNITRAAEAAQKNRRAFWQLIRRHQIDVQRFKPDNSL
ncbi:MAG TPA: sigma-54 dependent transcriptional regulator [Pyrinomonadaceae bacterium]|jgi:DNA-binding NtrC family response regulator|nr:sigma-54 dependent transcriptional regulator [Pyrinomonadaceae bacterium]